MSAAAHPGQPPAPGEGASQATQQAHWASQQAALPPTGLPKEEPPSQAQLPAPGTQQQQQQPGDRLATAAPAALSDEAVRAVFDGLKSFGYSDEDLRAAVHTVRQSRGDCAWRQLSEAALHQALLDALP